MRQRWWRGDVGFAATPTVANGVVYQATSTANAVFAYNANGNHLWDSGKQVTGGILTSLTIINGILLVADYSGNPAAFGP